MSMSLRRVADHLDARDVPWSYSPTVSLSGVPQHAGFVWALDTSGWIRLDLEDPALMETLVLLFP